MPIRPFTDTLREIRDGDALNEISAKLNQVVGAVRETGKAGTVTLKLTIKPAGKGNVSAIFVEDMITSKLPKHDTGSTIFFPTPEDNLQRKNPAQDELPGLRSVTETRPELIDLSTGEILEAKNAR